MWHDTDSDGVQDLGEPGIPGVWIDLVEAGPDELFDTADDLTFDPWRSDEVGLYAFGGLPAGLYRVDADETGAALAARTLVSGSDPLIISLAEGEAFTEANFGYGYLAAVQMAGFQALAGPGAVTLDWQVILTDPLPADFLVLRSGPTNSGLRVLTPQPVGPYNIQGQVAFYRFLDRTIAPGRTYRYWLEDHEGDRYGPWAVSLPGSQVFLPLVGLQHP